jgi:hypothetical protein
MIRKHSGRKHISCEKTFGKPLTREQFTEAIRRIAFELFDKKKARCG